MSKPFWFSRERAFALNESIFDKTTSATAWCEAVRSFGDSLCTFGAIDELTLPFKKASKLLLIGRSN